MDRDARVVKKLGPPVTAAHSMVWIREWAAISADAEKHNSRPVLQPGRMFGSWVGDGEANCSLQTPPAIVQHGARRQTRSGRFAVVVPQDAVEDLAFDGEPASLVVVEECSFLSGLLPEYLILSEDVLDGVPSPAIGPAGEHQGQ